MSPLATAGGGGAVEAVVTSADGKVTVLDGADAEECVGGGSGAVVTVVAVGGGLAGGSAGGGTAVGALTTVTV